MGAGCHQHTPPLAWQAALIRPLPPSCPQPHSCPQPPDRPHHGGGGDVPYGHPVPPAERATGTCLRASWARSCCRDVSRTPATRWGRVPTRDPRGAALSGVGHLSGSGPCSPALCSPSRVASGAAPWGHRAARGHCAHPHLLGSSHHGGPGPLPMPALLTGLTFKIQEKMRTVF